MTAPPPPVLVCSGPQDVPAAVQTLTTSGWSVRPGFALPEEPWDLGRRRWACQGAVDSTGEAEQATWALVRGCALIVTPGANAPPEFLDDLGRAGQVQPVAPALIVDERLEPIETALLELLADGHSVAEAGASLYLSPRTAQRRLTSARAALGVRSTREAVVVWTKLTRRARPD